MPFAALNERITADARREAEIILAGAKKQARAVLAEREAATEEEREARLDAARTKASDVVRQRLATAKLAARDRIVFAKQDLIDEVFHLAEERWRQLDEAVLIEVYAAMIADTAEGGENVVFDTTGNAAKIIEKANELMIADDRPPVRLAKEKREFGPGLILVSENIEQNLSLASILAQARLRFEGDVVKELFAELK